MSPVTSLPELYAADTFDVEAMMAAHDAPAVASETEPAKDQNPGEEDDDQAQDPNTESADDVDKVEGIEPGETAEADATSSDEADDKAEVVQDQTGKKLIGVRHFNRVLRQRNEAKAAMRALESKLAEATTKLNQIDDKPVVVPVREDPLAAVTNTEQLEATESNAKAWRAWCRRNPNGGTPPVQGAEEMDAEQVANSLEWAESILEAAPVKRTFLSEFTQTRAQVRKEMPQMFTPGTEEHTAYQSLQRKLLNFRTAADQDAIIARLIKMDRQEREERAGVARYARVELKPKSKDDAKTTAQVVTTKPSPKAGQPSGSLPAMRAATGVTPRQAVQQKLAESAAVDIEELYAGAA